MGAWRPGPNSKDCFFPLLLFFPPLPLFFLPRAQFTGPGHDQRARQAFTAAGPPFLLPFFWKTLETALLLSGSPPRWRNRPPFPSPPPPSGLKIVLGHEPAPLCGDRYHPPPFLSPPFFFPLPGLGGLSALSCRAPETQKKKKKKKIPPPPPFPPPFPPPPLFSLIVSSEGTAINTKCLPVRNNCSAGIFSFFLFPGALTGIEEPGLQDERDAPGPPGSPPRGRSCVCAALFSFPPPLCGEEIRFGTSKKWPHKQQTSPRGGRPAFYLFSPFSFPLQFRARPGLNKIQFH